MTEDKPLRDTLLDFQARFNDHPRVFKLIQKWDRVLLLHAEDTDEYHKLIVRDHKLDQVTDGHEDDENDIHIQATKHTLARIYSGDYNPATALLDGMVELYCSDKDKVKLEAISMVMWGLAKK